MKLIFPVSLAIAMGSDPEVGPEVINSIEQAQQLNENLSEALKRLEALKASEAPPPTSVEPPTGTVAIVTVDEPPPPAEPPQKKEAPPPPAEPPSSDK